MQRSTIYGAAGKDRPPAPRYHSWRGVLPHDASLWIDWSKSARSGTAAQVLLVARFAALLSGRLVARYVAERSTRGAVKVMRRNGTRYAVFSTHCRPTLAGMLKLSQILLWPPRMGRIIRADPCGSAFFCVPVFPRNRIYSGITSVLTDLYMRWSIECEIRTLGGNSH